MALKFIDESSPLQRVDQALRAAMERAQVTALIHSFSSAGELCAAACERVGLPTELSRAVENEAMVHFANLPHKQLVEKLKPHASKLELSHSGLVAVVDNIQLLRAFPTPDRTVELVRSRVEKAVDSFPRSASHLEQGKNPGDVLDPFLLSATQYLMCSGSIEEGLGAGVVHKCMMMLEDLVGNLHQDVIGSMRGNVRVPEPRGESLAPETNPFPGVDVLQVPLEAGAPLRTFQIKNKTGSAKGGDGIRLGQQLRQVRRVYSAEVYYVAILGRTLRGHRSMAGVLKSCPEAIIAVGETAMNYLTCSPIGGELLLRVYQSAFRDVARARGYAVREIALSIAQEFRSRLQVEDEDLLDGILRDVTGGLLEEQDSRYWKPSRGGEASRSRGRPSKGRVT